MLERAVQVIEEVRRHTDSVLLWHSLSGKDSIALLDLLYPRFRRVACLFQYMVKGLESELVYADYANRKYPNIEFYQVPHFVLFTYIKTGCMGVEKDKEQRLYEMNDMNRMVKERLGIEWACFGFKQSDSFNRKLTLRSYKDGMEAICWRTRNFYPLSTYQNKDVLRYIRDNNLKQPTNYDGKGQSSGCVVNDPAYLEWLRDNWPNDYRKMRQAMPKTKFIIRLNENKQQREDGDWAE
jgi:sulfate adenylyltransferase subunit 2